jgi:hypothetical protein
MIRQAVFGLNRLGSVGFADPGPLGFPILESPSQSKRTPLPGAAELSLAVHVPKRPKSIKFIEFYKRRAFNGFTRSDTRTRGTSRLPSPG